MTPRTVSAVVEGEKKAAQIAAALVRRSQSFAVEPLPADCYEFTVKAENAGLLGALVLS